MSTEQMSEAQGSSQKHQSEAQRPLKILFTGDYLPEYNRTQIIRQGLRKLGHEVIDLPFSHKSIRLFSNKKNKIKKSILQHSASSDFIFLPSFTHQQVKFVRGIVGNSKFIIFDPLVSRYLTKVFDYKLVSPYGLSALRNFYRDKWSMSCADFVIADTQAHLNYFHNKFKISKDKMGVLYIGNNFEEYYPAPEDRLSKKFRVGFYGGFIPLQGVLNILKAAEMLKTQDDIQFEIIGSGFQFKDAQKFVQEKNLQNVNLPGWITYPELRDRIQNFDLALGIFGDSEKSNLVIPNKLYHYAGCARAIVTKDTPAVREIFTDQQDLILTTGQPDELAKIILNLKSNSEMRKKMGLNIFNKIKANYNEVSIARQFIHYFNIKASRH